ncbi:malectin domain-containing carbohydrate-binding protein [Saccharicrinis sp. FJH2]|uniref:malectin domain-containing carbohydrate-binding protein n=1 Tax=Saccharicrinis sp. FJH65 TaxID=3344659 RepID=UPI0035F306E4
MRLTSIILAVFLIISINLSGKTDGTTGIPLGGIGTGAIKFRASNGTFSYNFTSPTRNGNYKTLNGAKFKIFTERGTSIETDDLLSAVITDGRADDDAIFPLHRVNFGKTNNVSVNMTLYMAYDQYSVDNMCHPAMMCEMTLENLEASEVTVSPAFQLATASNPLGITNSGFIASGVSPELCLLASTPDHSGVISYGNDANYATTGVYNNTISGSTNSVAAKVTLAANETKTIRFVIAWYRADDTSHYYYTNLWNSAKEVAVSALDKFDTFKANSEELVNRMRASNLPEWLIDQTLNSTATLVNNSVYFKDGRYCHTEGQWEPEGTMDQMWHARQIFTMINPELAWKELEWWARTQHVTSYAGQIHHDFGTYFNYVGWDDTEHEDYRDIDKWVDLNCGFILSVYETFNATAEQEKLDYFWPYVKKAGQRILDQVKLYGSSQYPYTFASSESTYDAGGNSQAYNTGLSIVAYKMMTELATIKGETELVTTYSTALESAVTGFEARWLDKSYPLGNYCESAMVNLWIANYSKINPFWDKSKLDNLFINMLVYYDPVNKGMGLPGGSYSEWQPYLVAHLGGYALQTNRSDVWLALQKDMYERNYLNRNLVFNHELGVPPKVTTPTYIATSTDGSDEYISTPVLWRNFYNLAGYHYNQYTGELWLEPKLFEGVSELDSIPLITPEGYVTISYKASGDSGQNQTITFTPDNAVQVNAIYVSDKYTGGDNSVSMVQVNGSDVAYERTGKGDLSHIKISYSGTIPSSGINVQVEGDARITSGDAPSTPTGFNAASSSASQVDLTWNATSEELLGYIVDKKVDGNFQTLAILGPDVTSYSEIGLQEATEYTYRLRSYNVFGISNPTDEVVAATQSVEEGVIVQAYNFGDTYTAVDGTEYLSMPSQYVSGGRSYSTSSTNIAGTEDDELYKTEQFGTFSINIPLENGKYNVILKMAEIYHNSPNSRLFNVNVEGKRVIENLDIFAQVGKDVAYDVIIPVEMTDGTLNINLITVTDNAKINALAIEKLITSSLNGSTTDRNNGFALNQNYPNPASTTTTINYSLNHPGQVNLVLLDVNGREINHVVNQQQNQGSYKEVMNVSALNSGVYYYRLGVDGQFNTKRMIIIK